MSIPIQSVDDFASEVSQIISAGNLNDAMGRVANLVFSMYSDQRTYGRVFCSRQLDDLCVDAARVLGHRSPAGGLEEDLFVHIGTDWAPLGGHTKVVGDLMRAMPEKRHIVLMPNIMPNPGDPARFRTYFPPECNVHVECSPRVSFADQARWMRDRLAELRPGAVCLMQHHFDVVALVACCALDDVPIYFYHHADFSLCLGVTIEKFLRVDTNPSMFYFCQQELGLKVHKYWPLTADDRKARRTPDDFLQPGVLRTAASGSAHKFERIGKVTYASVMAEMLKRTGGWHLHIGPLSDSYRNLIVQELSSRKVPINQFAYVPLVESVWDTLVANRIDILIGSFPMSGGKTMVEAMGAGIPLLMPRGYEIYRGLSLLDMAYEGAFEWATPDDIWRQLDTLQDRKVLSQHSIKARRHFETTYAFQLLVDAVRLPPDVPGIHPPPLRPQYPDFMQMFLDDARRLKD